MSGQIRTWDKREESIDDATTALPELERVLRLDEAALGPIDRLELILQLREVQEPSDGYLVR